MARRIALIALAFLGTAAYAASFLALPAELRPAWLPRLALGVAIASGVSWPVLGVVLLRASPDRTTLRAWFDACLVTIALGEIWLLGAAAWNLCAALLAPAPGVLLGAHLALLLGADATMGAAFTRRAARLGMTPRRAIAVWALVMNGVFAAQLVLYARPLGYWPW